MNNRFRAEKSGGRLLELLGACIVESVPRLKEDCWGLDKNPRPRVANPQGFPAHGEYSRANLHCEPKGLWFL